MTQDPISIQHKIFSQKSELTKLQAKEKKLSIPGFFDSIKLAGVQSDIESVQSSIKDYETRLVEAINQQNGDSLKELEEKAYYGDQQALEKLIQIAKTNPGAGERAKQILENLAQNGDQATAKILLDNFGKDGQILAALVKGNSAYADDAAANIAEIMDMGGSSRNINGQNSNVEMTSKLEELVLDKLCSDPEKNIHLIAKFANKERGAIALSNIAQDKPTSYAGRMAAMALGKAFISGSEKVASIALKGLIAAGSAGNVDAVNTLSGIAKSQTVSTKKAMQAVDALAEIASSAAQAGSDTTNTAMGALIGIAKNNRVSPNIRAHAVNHLGNLIQNGNDPNMNATDALIDIARNDNNNVVASQARKNIFKAAEGNPEVLNRGVDLFNDVAKGEKAAPNKERLQAVDLLGLAAQIGGDNTDKALNHLTTLTRNPNKMVGKRATDTLQNLGFSINNQEQLIKGDTTSQQDDKKLSRPEKSDFMIYS